MSSESISGAGERGQIVPVGGGEKKVRDAEILRRFADLCGGRSARIVIIPTASKVRETGRRYERVFRDFDRAEARSITIESRSDCEDGRILDAIESATGVFLTGGDQLRLSTNLGGTAVARMLQKRNAEGLHVMGTSAGAAFLCEHMIARGDEGPTPRTDMVTLAPGLGLTKQVIIDQHFRQRDRLGRLLSALAYNPIATGLGLDEDTAAFIGPDYTIEVVGSGGVTVVDPSKLGYSSMDASPVGHPVSLFGLRMHILTNGDSYSMVTRRAEAGPARSRS